FTALDVQDVRFPTSRSLDGSDAMNPDPDYSAAYLSLRTDAGDEGTALVFTIGRATTCSPRRSPPSSRTWWDGTSKRSSPTSAGCTASSPTTRSCAGWGPRRA